MPNAHASYKNDRGEELHLFVDIDLKEKIVDLTFKGDLLFLYREELEEIKGLVLNHNISTLEKLKRTDLKNEVRLKNSHKPIACLSLWLIDEAIKNYKGQDVVLAEQNDLLCLCYGLGERDLKAKLQAKPQYDLSDLIKETLATTACARCKDRVFASMEKIRNAMGIVPGAGQVPSRFNPDGTWVKIKGLYPAEVLLTLDELINKWLQREKLFDLQIEIKKIEGYHLWLSFMPEKKEAEALPWLKALSDYLLSELGVLFFLHPDIGLA